jgi:hypothetical protein
MKMAPLGFLDEANENCKYVEKDPQNVYFRRISIIIIIIIATGWMIGVLGFDSRRGLGIFSSPPRPERLWGSPSLLSNGHQGLLPWG